MSRGRLGEKERGEMGRGRVGRREEEDGECDGGRKGGKGETRGGREVGIDKCKGAHDRTIQGMWLVMMTSDKNKTSLMMNAPTR